MQFRSTISLSIALLCAIAHASALVVTTTADSGAGSLRQAIVDAPSGDTITFDAALSGKTILLTSGQFAVGKNLTIDASSLAGGITIDGNAIGRIFEFGDGTTNTLTWLTLTRGSSLEGNGGAILVNRNAELTLNYSTLSGNSALYGSGIYNAGTLTLNHSTLSDNSASGGYLGEDGNGGGVFNSAGTVTLSNCTLAGNSAAREGGGVDNSTGAIMSLSNCTLVGNRAREGGGVYNSDTMTLTNCTLAGNRASYKGGGVCNASRTETLTLSNCTLSGNQADFMGGGVYIHHGTLNWTNSIVSGNIANVMPNLYSGDSAITGSNNLIDVNPQLAPLGSYGGPTQTMPPLPGSPAIDAGIDTGSLPATDQRGLARVIGGGVDIGAVEKIIPTVTTLADSGAGSLRQVIVETWSEDTIIFDAALSGQTIVLTSGQLSVAKDLTIDASALAGGITMDGNHNGRLFEFGDGTTNVLAGLTLTGGQVSGGIGGAVLVNPSAMLALNHCTLAGNSADQGGGVYNDAGTLTLSNSTLSGNAAVTSGGGVYNSSGTLTLNNSTLAGNSAPGGAGGGLFNELGTLNCTNSIVAGNTADSAPNLNATITAGSNNLIDIEPQLAPLGDYGGPTQTLPPLPGSPAIDSGIDTGSLPATDQRGLVRVVGSAVDIGAVEKRDPVVTTLSDSGPGSLRQMIAEVPSSNTITFANELAGKIIVLTSGQLTVGRNLTIDASSLAGGITIDGNANGRLFEFNSGTTNVLTGLTLTRGQVPGAIGAIGGGAILLKSSAALTLNHSTLTGNSADHGGGIYNDAGTLTLNSSTFSGNSAIFGGGVYHSSGTLTLNSSTFSRNSASAGGAGYINSGTVTLRHSTLSANTAAGGAGGGVFNDGGTLSCSHSIVAGNTAAAAPNLYSASAITGSNNLIDVEARLIPLGDYGGSTQTMPPQTSSPAVDAGTNSGSLPTTDQRGLARVAGASVDIGAVELTLVEKSASIVTTVADSGAGSLRQVIAEMWSGDTITFANALSGQTIVLTSGQLSVAKNLTIDASALAGGITLDGNANGRLFEFSGGTTNVLTGLSLSNGAATFGGAIRVNNSAALTLNDSTLTGNSADYGGGIVNETSATLTVNHCTFAQNAAAVNGGALFNRGTEATLNQSTLSGNSAAAGFGGAILNNASTLILGNTTVSGNSALVGGAILNDAGTLTLNNSTVSGNSAANGGGVYRLNADTFYCTNSIVAGNTADAAPNLNGTFTAGSNNLIDVDPRLAPLGDYGGATRTMPPLPGSPAIEGAIVHEFTPPTDQLGNVRPAGPSPDIGAVEALPLAGTPGFVDSDSDGIDDRLESAIFGNLSSASATSDADGDGSSDKEELANMTNPRDGASRFKVLAMTPTVNFNPAGNAEFEVTFSTFPGLRYQLQTSNTLAGFQPLSGSTFTAAGYTNTMPVVLTDSRGFVRAIRLD